MLLFVPGLHVNVPNTSRVPNRFGARNGNLPDEESEQEMTFISGRERRSIIS